ncbi:MAG: methyltransferase domain-containing protein, partial [Gammaproteobacteria bacterium]
MNFSQRITWSPADYDLTSAVAKEAGQEMLTRLDWMTLQPKTIVDIGCGTGGLSLQLQERYPEAKVIAIDITESMLRQAKSPLTRLCADAVALPLKSQSVDLLFANFLLPWCHTDIKKVLQEWRRVLRVEGLLMLTALGPDTLREWRGVLNEADTPPLIDMHDIGDVLMEAGFSDPVLDVDYYTTTYREVNQLLYELKASGMM